MIDDKSLAYVLRALLRYARGQQDIAALVESERLVALSLPPDEREAMAARQAAERDEMEKRHALERA